MENSEIKEQVDYQVKQWISLQERIEIDVKITPKAIDFICLMIDNIESDKSAHWKFIEFESKTAQQYAISLIPNALNELMDFNRYLRHFSNRGKIIEVSSWEIWHSLSKILNSFCFIPKDI